MLKGVEDVCMGKANDEFLGCTSILFRGGKIVWESLEVRKRSKVLMEVFVFDEQNHFTFSMQVWLMEVILIVLFLETMCPKKEVLINTSTYMYVTNAKSKYMCF